MELTVLFGEAIAMIHVHHSCVANIINISNKNRSRHTGLLCDLLTRAEARVYTILHRYAVRKDS